MNRPSTKNTEPVPHWADAIAAEVGGIRPSHNISTGISPSGEIHIGNLREVLSGDLIFRALRDAGRVVSLHWVADNFDPLRRVYPFLDGKKYEPHLGKPLFAIPCPCDRHSDYSEHFMAPFLDSLPRLGIHLEVIRSSDLYGAGRMNRLIVKALEARDRIARILEETTGKRTREEWSPFQVVCHDCGRMSASRVTGFSAERETVDFTCDCGAAGAVPMAGGGKLTWRVDWPARWTELGVTVEPFGKDHATEGGSYESGARIIREVFGAEPPHPVTYEWIHLRGRGDMSSSKGNVIGIADALAAIPPEVLRYLIVRTRPMKTIGFDPGRPLLSLVDEYESLLAEDPGSRVVALTRIEGFRRVGIPFRHLVSVYQMAAGDLAEAERILERGGYPVNDRDALRGRMGQARSWLERFAPEEEKFSLQDELPEEGRALSEGQKRFLSELAAGLEEGMDGEAVHRLIYDARERAGLEKPAAAFQAIYLTLLGKRSGPRAGWFLSILEIGFVKRRFGEAAGRTG